MHNEVWGCAEILPSALSFTFQRLRTRPIGTDESIGEFRGT